MWGQIAALAASLAMVLGLGWYLLRPPSADALYRKIEAIAADERPAAILDAEDDIHRFLTRFPGDPRAAQMKADLEEIDLLRWIGGSSVARGNCRPASRSRPSSAIIWRPSIARTLPPSDPFASCKRLSTSTGKRRTRRTRPRRFWNSPAASSSNCAALDRLEAPPFLAVIDESLRKADELRATDPAQARTIWSGLVELYADKPWAADRVARAKTALSETAGVVTSPP